MDEECLTKLQGCVPLKRKKCKRLPNLITGTQMNNIFEWINVDDIFIWIPKSATTQMITNDDHFADDNFSLNWI